MRSKASQLSLSAGISASSRHTRTFSSSWAAKAGAPQPRITLNGTRHYTPPTQAPLLSVELLDVYGDHGITAALVSKRLGLAVHMLVPLPMDTPTEIDGVQVTCIDANHCPGAVLLLFELGRHSLLRKVWYAVLLYAGIVLVIKYMYQFEDLRSRLKRSVSEDLIGECHHA